MPMPMPMQLHDAEASPRSQESEWTSGRIRDGIRERNRMHRQFTEMVEASDNADRDYNNDGIDDHPAVKDLGRDDL